MRSHRLRPVALTVTALVLAAGCTSGSSPGPVTSSSGGTGQARRPGGTASLAVLPASSVVFGSYRVVPMTNPDTPAYRGPAAPTSLAGVRIGEGLKDALKKPKVSDTLTRQGFVVVPEDLRQLHFAYQESAYSGWPVYVTTDSGYHIWHLAFDSILRRTEEQSLLPALRSLVEQTLPVARSQTTRLQDTPLAEDAARAEQLYQVAAAELGIPVTLGPLAAQEKSLVDAHSGIQISPLLNTSIDYSLMTPRGHYTRSAALKRYFAAMSVLGQSAFCLPGTNGCDAEKPGRPTRVGLLATRSLLGSPQRKALWQKLYESTAFLVGFSDDYTPLELDAAVTASVPGWPGDPSALADDAKITEVVGRLKQTRPVRINAETASSRLLGTRFVLDSYILDQLVSPNVKDNPAGDRRLLPSGLDVAATFGSAKARQELDRSGAMAFKGYPEQLERMTSQVAERPPAAWGGTVYDAWLYALQPVLASHGTAYPPMMRTDAWAAKNLQSGLGSYAQLKHDTILYTKQSVAEGGGDTLPPPPRNWVEPEPVAFARLAAAVDLLRDGLSRRGLLSKEQRELATETSSLLALFARVAADELRGKAITKADNETLGYVGEAFEALWFKTSDVSEGEVSGDNDSALIADIASGPGGILEVGTGRFDRILVLVPDDSGRFQVASGGVFSYHEFSSGPGTRLTDEAWRARLDSGKAPARPGWQSVLLAR